MHIENIVTLANAHPKIRLTFLAMERSLRTVGCQLPLLVIPYDDNRFDLPPGATWWEMPEVSAWIRDTGAVQMMRKYQCLTLANYQYADTDICFLRNPEEVLRPFEGWVACCTEWNKPEHTYTEESLRVLSRVSSTWQKSVFSAGQFASDRPVFAGVEALKAMAGSPDLMSTCLHPPSADQDGFNLMVALSGVPVTNLTLPPHCMESTWAGDYPGEYERLWADPIRKPYMIHWAGPTLEQDLPINEIFYGYLTRAEKAEWDEVLRQSRAAAQKKGRWPLLVRLCNQVVKRVDRRFHVQPRRLTFS